MNDFIAAYCSNRYRANKLKADNQELVYYNIKSQLRKAHFDKPVRVLFEFYEPNGKRDVDNIAGFAHKVIFDALVQAKVIEDDAQKYVYGFTDSFFVDRKNPRIVVTIWEVD